MPLWPRRIFCHKSSTLQLSEVTAPTPVTTTRRFIRSVEQGIRGHEIGEKVRSRADHRELNSARGSSRPAERRSTLPVCAAFNVLNGLADGLNLFRGVVRNVDVELFFQFHHQLDRIQRI